PCTTKPRIACESAGSSSQTMSFGLDVWLMLLSTTVKPRVFARSTSCSTETTATIRPSCRFGMVLRLDFACDEVSRMKISAVLKIKSLSDQCSILDSQFSSDGYLHIFTIADSVGNRR